MSKNLEYDIVKLKAWLLVFAVLLLFVVGGMGLQVMFNQSQTRFNEAVIKFQDKAMKQFEIHNEESHTRDKE